MDNSAAAANDHTHEAASWDAKHERLYHGWLSLDGMSAEEQQALLQARARRYAQPWDDDVLVGDHLDVVEFVLAGEHYAIETRYISEVCRLRSLTPIPCTPSFVRGVINLHGRIVSVTDLKPIFGLPEGGITDLNRVIVLHHEQMEFGILADDVVGGCQVPVTCMAAAQPTLGGQREQYLLGITPERLIVLHGAALLSDTALIVNDEG